MNKTFKTFLFASTAALAIAGCSSYSEVAYWKSPTKINDGETPVATFLTQNFSYQLLGFIPLCTGLPWTSGSEDYMDDFNIRLFADEATIDNNLVSLKYALKRVGSNRVTNLNTTTDDDSLWSLFLVNRHEVRTKAIILPPKAPEAK